jgi:dTDP-4-amino-4,6-dideoxygalactose transaminase
MAFEIVREFESIIANYYDAPYAVATDSCTHALELCLRYEGYDKITIPTNTYISVPFTAKKLSCQWSWKNEKWENYYFIGNTNIIDAAVYWSESGYIPNTYMCLSFQYHKHLNIGKGGMILLDNYESYEILKKMSYDGRSDDLPWGDQDISTMGYHYYMTPESAEIGINKFKEVVNLKPKIWSYKNYPYLPKMKVFK